MNDDISTEFTEVNDPSLDGVPEASAEGNHGPLDLLLDAIAAPDHPEEDPSPSKAGVDIHPFPGDTHNVEDDASMKNVVEDDGEEDAYGEDDEDLMMIEGQDAESMFLGGLGATSSRHGEKEEQDHPAQSSQHHLRSPSTELDASSSALQPNSIQGLLEASKMMDRATTTSDDPTRSATEIASAALPSMTEDEGELSDPPPLMDTIVVAAGPRPGGSKKGRSSKGKGKLAALAVKSSAVGEEMGQGSSSTSASTSTSRKRTASSSNPLSTTKKRKRPARSTSPNPDTDSNPIPRAEDSDPTHPKPSRRRPYRTKASIAAAALAAAEAIDSTKNPTPPQPEVLPSDNIHHPHETKISRMFAATRGPNGSRIPEQSMSFSSITLLHGNVAQKTYSKEKRFLNPPPVVRMNGSVSDTVDSISLQIVNHDIGEGIPVISNNQGVDFAPSDMEVQARGYLREGLYFAGLFASQTGKAKALKLRLQVYQPGGTDARPDDDGKLDPPPATGENNSLSQRDRAYHMDVDMGLGEEAEQEPALYDISSLAAQTMARSIEGIHELQQSREEGDEVRLVEGDEAVPMELLEEEEILVDESKTLKSEKGKGKEIDPVIAESEVAERAGGENLPEVPVVDNEAGEEGENNEGQQDDDAPVPGNAMIRDIGQNSSRPWAEFSGTPITIISKPSKKTTKTKHVEGGLTLEIPVAFWSRVNSQAVRTKYLHVEQGRLTGRPCDWTAFVIDVIRRGSPSQQYPKYDLPGNLLTFGSTIILRDIHSGYRSEPLLICKLMAGKVVSNEYGPVIDMQRIALAKVVPGQGIWYARAPGSEKGLVDEVTGKALPRLRRKLRDKDPLNQSLLKKMAPAFDREDELDQSSFVSFAAPKVKVEEVDGVMEEYEFLDDFLSWTITGITEHNYTFFEGRHEVGDFSTVFKTALTPIPASIDIPVYRNSNNTLTMTVTNFLYDDDNIAFRNKPLLIYLGAIGPLTYRSYRSMASRLPVQAKSKTADPYFAEYNRYPAIPIDGGEELAPEDRPYSSIPNDVPHVILVINLPAPEDIWDATRIERERAEERERLKAFREEAAMKEDQEDEMDDDWEKFEGPFPVFAGKSLLLAEEPKSATPAEETAEGTIAEVATPPATDAQDAQDAPVERETPSKVEAGQPQSEIDSAQADILLPSPQDQSGPVIQDLAALSPGAAETMEEPVPDASTDINQMNPHGFPDPDDYDHVDAASLDPTTGLPIDPSDSHHAHLDHHTHLDQPFDATMLNTFEGSVSSNVHDMFTAAALEAAAASGNPSLLASASMLAPNGQGGMSPHALQHGTMSSSSMGMHDERYLEFDGEGDSPFGSYGHASANGNASGLGNPNNNNNNESGQLHAKIVRAKELRPKRERRRRGAERLPKAPKPPKPVKPKAIPKPRPRIIRPTLHPAALSEIEPPPVRLSKKPFLGPLDFRNPHRDNNPMNLENLGGNSSLPLLFVRPSDGTGYHTGKNVVIEKGFAEGEWTIRVPS